MNRVKLFPRLSISLIVLVVFSLLAFAHAGAAPGTVIDFEGIPAGTILDSLSFGNGISGDAVSGSVAVVGVNPIVPSRNSAVIFDGTCQPGGTPADCSGDDDDLFYPDQGNILIVNIPWRDTNADGIVDAGANDDDRVGMMLKFDFAGLGSGSVSIASLDIMDVEYAEGEDGGHIDLYAGGEGGVLLGSVNLPNVGNNGIATLPIGVDGVDFMVVTLNGSGAIDNIQLGAEEQHDSPGTGTPGYWMNHPEAWPVDEIVIGGITYSREEAIAWMQAPVKGDKTLSMFPQLVSAKLNVLIGNEDSCIADTIAAADSWMTTYPVGSGVKANSDAWDVGGPLHDMLDDYNNGLLCAPHRG